MPSATEKVGSDDRSSVVRRRVQHFQTRNELEIFVKEDVLGYMHVGVRISAGRYISGTYTALWMPRVLWAKGDIAVTQLSFMSPRLLL